jgi:hypothetical protein
MRNASGNLVEVRVREPWALHLLTADGTNAAVDEAETMNAPAEPGLVQLTPTGVAMLVERYVRFRVETKYASYFAALPGSFVTALMQFSPSAIPIVRAINTAPLVTPSGRVIDGVGLDRDTGLVHRIDPLLRACVPPNPPTEQDVRAAATYLFDEWLVDVALDPIGKSIAIMLAIFMRKPALPEAGILPKGGILRLYGRAKIHKSGAIYEDVWTRLIEAEKKSDPEKKGYAVLITIESAEDLSGQPLT